MSKRRPFGEGEIDPITGLPKNLNPEMPAKGSGPVNPVKGERTFKPGGLSASAGPETKEIKDRYSEEWEEGLNPSFDEAFVALINGLRVDFKKDTPGFIAQKMEQVAVRNPNFLISKIDFMSGYYYFTIHGARGVKVSKSALRKKFKIVNESNG